MNYKIRNIELSDIEQVLAFTDKWIGENYFTKAELRDSLIMGVYEDLNASFMAMNNDNQIIGIRITYLPGKWLEDIHLASHISPDQWSVPISRVAYFKSLFVSSEHQSQGVARELNIRSLDILRHLDVLAVVCHAWLESPDNSSINFLKKMKFEPLETYKDFWFFKNYECIKCSPKSCGCSAQEMIYYFPVLSIDDDDEIIQGTR